MWSLYSYPKRVEGIHVSREHFPGPPTKQLSLSLSSLWTRQISPRFSSENCSGLVYPESNDDVSNLRLCKISSKVPRDAFLLQRS